MMYGSDKVGLNGVAFTTPEITGDASNTIQINTAPKRPENLGESQIPIESLLYVNYSHTHVNNSQELKFRRVG